MMKWFTDDDFDQGLSVHRPNEVQRERQTRWITRELYIQIQCCVLEDQLRFRKASAIEHGKIDRKADELIDALLRCEDWRDQAQWLQNYKGRALLSCTACMKNDVAAVMELWEDGIRARICSDCCKKFGLDNIYFNG